MALTTHPNKINKKVKLSTGLLLIMILGSGCFDQSDQVAFQTCTDAEKTVDAAQKHYQQFLYGLAEEGTGKEVMAEAVVMQTLKDAEEEAFQICEGN